MMCLESDMKSQSLIGRRIGEKSVKAALLVSVTVLIPLASSAQLLPAAQYDGTLVVGDSDGYTSHPVSNPGTYAYMSSDTLGGSASTTLQVSNVPDPSLTLSTSASGAPINGVLADTVLSGSISGPFNAGLLSYNVEFLGPSGSVPIQVDAKVGASLSPIALGAIANQVSSASFFVGQSGTEVFQDYVYIVNQFPGGSGAVPSGYTADFAGDVNYLNYSPTTGISGGVVDSHVWLAQTNVVYTVTLGLSNSLYLSGYLGGGQMHETAFVDPTFAIAAIAPNPALYSIITSPGIGNIAVGAVPEPPMYLLVIAGLIFLGAAARSKLLGNGMHLCAGVSRRE